MGGIRVQKSICGGLETISYGTIKSKTGFVAGWQNMTLVTKTL